MAEVVIALGRRRQRAFFVINSIDSDFLTDAATQQALLLAAASDSVFVAASTDRPPAFSLSFYTQMRFCVIRVDTMRPYAQEIGFGAGGQGGGMDSIDRFVLVLRTLTGTANGIFRVLLAHQLKSGEGLQRSEWLDRAISELCMRLQGTFRAQINEFLDHRLVAEKKGECFVIPLSPVQLRTLLVALDGQNG
jgi:hypothetical protein